MVGGVLVAFSRKACTVSGVARIWYEGWRGFKRIKFKSDTSKSAEIRKNNYPPWWGVLSVVYTLCRYLMAFRRGRLAVVASQSREITRNHVDNGFLSKNMAWA